MRPGYIGLALMLTLAGGPRPGQTPPQPRFEVATVRSTPPETRGGGITITDARIDVRNTSLSRVLLEAFQVADYRIAAPDWLQRERFDIQATIPAELGRSAVPEMLQVLLAERFGLVSHTEKRPIPVLELVIADGGIRMREVEPVNELDKSLLEEGITTPDDTVEGEGDKRTRTFVTSSGVRVLTTQGGWDQTLTSRKTWELRAARMSIPDLVMVLSGMVDRPVVDMTGLRGVYEFSVELPGLMATGTIQRSGAGTARGGIPVAADPPGVSVFRAVESLGLKLESRRSPLDVIVIDKIARSPTPN